MLLIKILSNNQQSDPIDFKSGIFQCFNQFCRYFVLIAIVNKCKNLQIKVFVHFFADFVAVQLKIMNNY